MTRETTERDRGLGLALRIHRYCDTKTWRSEVDAIENEEERKVADDYFQGIVIRTRVVVALKRGENPRR